MAPARLLALLLLLVGVPAAAAESVGAGRSPRGAGGRGGGRVSSLFWDPTVGSRGGQSGECAVPS